MATTAPQRIFPPASTTAPHFRERIYSYVHAIIRVLSGLKRDGFGRKFANSLFNPIQTAPSLINWITFNKTVQVRPPNLAKFIWEHFKVIVTCTSTLMLPWLPIFCGHFFFFWETCLFFIKKGFISIFTIVLAHTGPNCLPKYRCRIHVWKWVLTRGRSDNKSLLFGSQNDKYKNTK